MPPIMAAHRIPYAATLSIAHRDDFLRKLEIARTTKGFRFLVMLSPCPIGWKSASDESVELIDIAVRSGLFPLYEVFDGERYRINARPDGADVRRYLERQRRYSAFDIAVVEKRIASQWAYLDAMAERFPA